MPFRFPSPVVVGVTLALTVPALLSCSSPPPPKLQAAQPLPPPPYAGYSSPHYADPSSWLCLPGRDDTCAGNLDATELHADGSRTVVRDVPDPRRNQVDCFYVYPTVDLRLIAKTHTDFTDLTPIARTTLAQAARLRNVCRLFVPLYRQATIGVYLHSADVREPYLDLAASDVREAFLNYMGQYNGGRKVVLVGHSQGSEMVKRLLLALFDQDPIMRDKLLLAMPIGGVLDVPKGQVKGGTFANIPICTTKGETGCIVAYRSYAASDDPDPGEYTPPPGHASMCVDPVLLSTGHTGRYTRSFFPLDENTRGHMNGVDGVTTPFVMVRDYYEGTCKDGHSGFRFLGVKEAPSAGDVRQPLFDLSPRILHGKLGFHLFDFQFAQGDLMDLVTERLPAHP